MPVLTLAEETRLSFGSKDQDCLGHVRSLRPLGLGVYVQACGIVFPFTVARSVTPSMSSDDARPVQTAPPAAAVRCQSWAPTGTAGTDSPGSNS